MTKRWTPQNIALLGTMRDRELAERLGCCTSTITTARVRYGIPHYTLWSPADIALLGTMMDREVAERLGRTTVAVVYERRKRQIQALRRWKGTLKTYVSVYVSHAQREALLTHATEAGCTASELARRVLAEAGVLEDRAGD